jgi:hypothetical protein
MGLWRKDGPQIECPRCGGTSFTEQKFQQYRGGIHSSAPGGDISPASKHADVIQALVCLCGYVRLPPNRRGSQNGDAYNAFAECWEAAVAFQETVEEVDGPAGDR